MSTTGPRSANLYEYVVVGNAHIDAAHGAACPTAGGRFVDLSPIFRDARNQASAERAFENPAVGAHPGDRGMATVAEAIYAAAAY